MPVPTILTDLSVTAANNSPSGSETVGSSLDDYLRGYQAVIRAGLAHKGADIASATTTDLGAVAGLMHDITGTTTITGFGTVSAGIWKILKFEGALTLTHNATSLIIPGGANITTADGDIGIFISEGSGNWRCVTYFRAGVVPLLGDASDTQKGVIEVAIQSEMETGTSTTLASTPGRQHFHPGHPKAWGEFNGSSAATNASYNVTGAADTGTGIIAITIATDFSSANYALCVSAADSGVSALTYVGSKAAGSFVIHCVQHDGTAEDPDTYSFIACGDHA